jgi:F420-dependent oxidoreductase-like protein
LRLGLISSQVTNRALGLDALLAEAVDADRLGLASFWIPNIFELDGMTAAALAGERTQRIELATAVVPTPPRHPAAMAQQALTTQLVCEGRFTLGIGLSHEMVTKGMFGLSYDRPARQMREYLEVLNPLLRGERAEADGEFYRANLALEVPSHRDVDVIVAAMGPRMLRVTGRLAHGTIPLLAGPKTLESHIVPEIRAGAREAGRPEPRVVAVLPIALTSDVGAAGGVVDELFAVYTQIPSYAGMLEREGKVPPSSVALLGDEANLRAQLRRLEAVGVTDFVGALVPVDEGAAVRTREFLAAEAR